MSDELNQRIGDYEILGVLGAGGMGKVYRVRNVISDRVEAMKILLPSLSDHREVGERFLREIKLVASLHHPNIANLCTAQTLENHLIMVMEFVDGDTFSDLLDRRAVPLKSALNYFDQALAALGYAHARGIVHRDIKPSNIMLTPDGVVKLMDFGIARSGADRALTQTGATIGTVSYMSPEQIAGKSTDGRSDLYSMGIFLYETITGEQPFKGTSDYELMAAHMNQAPRPPAECVPGVPEELNRIILKLLAKEPENRFQTADAVREAIRSMDVFEGVAQGLPRPMQAAGVGGARTDFPALRSSTVVEGLSAQSGARLATTVEPRLGSGASGTSGTLVRDAYTDRRMTEVNGIPRYTPPPPVALAVQKKGFARHRVLYVSAGIAVAASAMTTLPVFHAHGDRIVKDEGRSSSSGPAAAGAAGAVPAAMGNGAGGANGASGVPAGAAPHAVGVLPNRTAPGPMRANSGLPGGSAAGATLAQVGGEKSGGVAVSGKAAVGGGEGTVAQPPPSMSPAVKAKLDQEEVQIDEIESHAVAINNSLNTMQRSMQKDGVSMRGDIAGKQAGMNLNLAKAKQALAMHDADRAGKFAALAQAEQNDLEAFLGR